MNQLDRCLIYGDVQIALLSANVIKDKKSSRANAIKLNSHNINCRKDMKSTIVNERVH